MALATGQLISDFTRIYKNNNRSHLDYAVEFAKAVVNYWETATAPGMGSVTASHLQSQIEGCIATAHANNRGSKERVATDIASCLNTVLGSVIVSGGLYGTGPCTPLGMSGLISDLIAAYSSNNVSIQQAANDIAIAIETFTKSTLCVGTGVETPTPIPKIGPLS